MRPYVGDLPMLKPTQLRLESHYAARKALHDEERTSGKGDDEVKLKDDPPHGKFSLGRPTPPLERRFQPKSRMRARKGYVNRTTRRRPGRTGTCCYERGRPGSQG